MFTSMLCYYIDVTTLQNRVKLLINLDFVYFYCAMGVLLSFSPDEYWLVVDFSSYPFLFLFLLLFPHRLRWSLIYCYFLDPLILFMVVFYVPMFLRVCGYVCIHTYKYARTFSPALVYFCVRVCTSVCLCLCIYLCYLYMYFYEVVLFNST